MVSRYGNIQDTVINQLYIYPVEQLDDIQVQRGYLQSWYLQYIS